MVLFRDLLELKEMIYGHIKLLRCHLEINSASLEVHYLQTGRVKLGRITGHIPAVSEYADLISIKTNHIYVEL